MKFVETEAQRLGFCTETHPVQTATEDRRVYPCVEFKPCLNISSSTSRHSVPQTELSVLRKNSSPSHDLGLIPCTHDLPGSLEIHSNPSRAKSFTAALGPKSSSSSGRCRAGGCRWAWSSRPWIPVLGGLEAMKEVVDGVGAVGRPVSWLGA